MRRNCISTSELFKTDALTCFEISDESGPTVSASYTVGAIRGGGGRGEATGAVIEFGGPSK